MTITESRRVPTAERSDLSLVTEALAGQRGGFERIVTRYQNLICSLAYSATGSIAQSEDLAQEIFVTAWKHLPRLREGEKLRAWLCGIARFTIAKALKKARREPSHRAEPLDMIAETSPASELLPAQQAISSEEEAILWRALERIPESYRQPLILFYREQQSVQAVARILEMSEDAVKQRLCRGRKLLHEEVIAMVEGGLARTAPGRAFTIGVLAALPALILPAQAAAAAGTLSASGTAKTALGSGTWFGSILAGPLLAIFGTWVGYRMDLDAAGSESERDLTKTFYRRLAWGLACFFAAFSLLMMFAREIANANELLFPGALIGLGIAYAGSVAALMIWWGGARARHLQGKTQSDVHPAWEYRSRILFCGMPLIHARIGGDFHANRSPVRAWIAIGDVALGGLFAFGGLAIAPLSIGGCAIGLLPFGGTAVGLLALGGFSAGVWAFGGLAFGWQAFGGCAIAWSAAAGGAAVAHDFALGAHAFASHANNAAAHAFIARQPFFTNGDYAFRHCMAWLNLIWVVPLLIWSRLIKRAKRTSTAAVPA
jgi:RNA polymerase sigma factor (sigma-70 family)